MSSMKAVLAYWHQRKEWMGESNTKKEKAMLFVIMGAGGSGKTVATQALRLQHSHVVWYDFDEIGVPPGADKRWRQRSTEQWLKVAREHQIQGQDMGLCGGMTLGEVLACPSAVQIDSIAACLLDCNDVVRVDRMRTRNADDLWISQRMLNWAAWLRMHAVDPQWRQDVIRADGESEMMWERWDQWQRGDARWQVWTFDTTHLPIDEVVKALSAWALEQKQHYVAGHGSLQGRWWEK